MDGLEAFCFVLGFGFLIFGAELLVRRASRLATAVGISPLVIGVTIVAYGTSAPEAAVSIRAVWADPPEPGISIGNVVGSNIANILLVLGVSAVMLPLAVSRTVLRRAVPQVIAVSLVVLLMALDGVIGRIEGACLFAGSLIYTIGAVYRGRQAGPTMEEEVEAHGAGPVKVPVVIQYVGDIALIIVGLALMVQGAEWLVNGATAIARSLGVSELVIGLSIVAIGTSLPEVATSVIATIRGKRDIAVGNIVGSNVFNLLLVLGLCSALSPIGIPISNSAIRFDLPIMVGVALLCWPIFYTGHVISRVEGGMLLAFYAAYLLFRFLEDSSNSQTSRFSLLMLYFVIPLAVILLAIGVVRQWRQNRAQL